MDKNYACVVLASAGMVLLGCTSESVTFRGPDGDMEVCSAAGTGVVPVVIAKQSMKECRERYLKSGYVEVKYLNNRYVEVK